jgi:hypothetical protein
MDAIAEPTEKIQRFHRALGFEYDGRSGQIVVFCDPCSDPRSIGQPKEAEGFPVLTATVEFDGRGYDAFFGWIQLVRSTDNRSGGREFEMDPLFLFRDVPSPYAFFGLTPTLFDAPSRRSRTPMRWLAHSFLALTPGDPELATELSLRRAVPLVGFSWGFDIEQRRAIVLRPVERLSAADWNRHIPLLRRSYSTWRFETVEELGRATSVRPPRRRRAVHPRTGTRRVQSTGEDPQV